MPYLQTYDMVHRHYVHCLTCQRIVWEHADSSVICYPPLSSRAFRDLSIQVTHSTIPECVSCEASRLLQEFIDRDDRPGEWKAKELKDWEEAVGRLRAQKEKERGLHWKDAEQEWMEARKGEEGESIEKGMVGLGIQDQEMQDAMEGVDGDERRWPDRHYSLRDCCRLPDAAEAKHAADVEERLRRYQDEPSSLPGTCDNGHDDVGRFLRATEVVAQKLG